MICQRMMVRGVKSVPETWQFTVNTEATAAGEKKTGMPFNLYNQEGVVLSVDWGDETQEQLSSADYTSSDSRKSVHEYAEAGIYTIQISSQQWVDIFPLTIGLTGAFSPLDSYNDANVPLYYFRRTLISVDSDMPSINRRNALYNNDDTEINDFSSDGIERIFAYCQKLVTFPSTLLSKNKQATSVYGLFEGCTGIISIPGTLFLHNTLLTNVTNCFRGCSSLSSVPSELFAKTIALENIRYCFYLCTSLSDFSLTINSVSVNYANYFVSFKSGATRTIYVPSGSTTETTFNAVASDLGLTIIGG